jgi:glyoxylase-like metal-dependent hydrolase (beta-lactamase superfamily II)
MLLVVTALGISSAWAAAPGVPSPAPQQAAPGVWVIQGNMIANREPDGNSVIFEVPEGLVVMDTGRHEWHRQAVLELARSRQKPIVAIINSHWHLDHVSGNPTLRAAYPGLKVYASDAIDRALTGFLASSAKEAARYVNDPQIPKEMRADIRADVLTIQNGAALRPDVVIRTSGSMDLGGHEFHINLASNAATNGDVWLYDETSGVAALGDLVTLPAPFLDTACPDGWIAALAQVTTTPFALAIPGHGAPMAQAQFSLYRRSFESFIDCSRSARPAQECAANWASAVRSLLPQDPDELQRARKTAGYYIDMLRANSGRSKYCEAPR